MTRIWNVSIALAPALVLVCLAWMFLAVGLALVFTVIVCVGCGYVARWLDEPSRHSVRGSFLP